MTEDKLRSYFQKHTTAEELQQDLADSVFNQGNTTEIKIIGSNQAEEFNITSQHLSNLLTDVINNKITTDELSLVSFCLETSDHFSWDNSNPEGERIAELISAWASPEINSKLTDEYLQYCSYYLETGEHR